MLDALLARHCAPAMAGMKPANLVALSNMQSDDLNGELTQLNHALNRSDIYLETLCACESRRLVLVYRGKKLAKHLATKDQRDFLTQFGYSREATLREDFAVLKRRLGKGGFPHEIGVFLGYPLFDIESFICHRDEGCLCTGEWKVYHNLAEAQQWFRRFRACRSALEKRVVEGGKTLAEIFSVA